MRLVIWGIGHDYNVYKEKLQNHEIILIDNDINKQGTIYDDKLIKEPQIIKEIDYDYVIVSSSKYYNEICRMLMEDYEVSEEEIICICNCDIEIMMREIGHTIVDKKKKGIKILFGYCFINYERCRLHDFLLAESLRRRGAEIIPLICGGIQEVQCAVDGGGWGDNIGKTEEEKRDKHIHSCHKCRDYNKKVWERWGTYTVISAVDEITDEEKITIRNEIESLELSDCKEWRYKEYPIGIWALRRYYNYNLISYEEEYNKAKEKELRSIAYNAALMCVVSEKIVDKINPNIIYSNDSFYYPYSILEFIAKKRNIPFYNAYGYRKDTYSYALNSATLDFPFQAVWKSFASRKLTDEENTFMDQYLSQRKYGKDMMINTATPWECIDSVNSESIHGCAVSGKRTALLATNVTWDAAALMRDTIYSNIIDWVIDTVDFFATNPQWQLIVRIHPAEVARLVPEAKERIGNIILEKYQNKLPDNIILIDGDAPVSIYDLFLNADVGLVYTSTVGLEMSCMGIPVITVGKAPYYDKGFTYEPVSKEMYFKIIEDLLTLDNDYEKEMRKEQAKKFFFLYYFVYMLPNPFFKYTYEEGAELVITDKNMIEEGKIPLWDYICDSIMTGKEIYSEDRLPPYYIKL